MNYNDFITKFYNGLWMIIKVILIICFIVGIIYLRIIIDSIYVNWLVK